MNWMTGFTTGLLLGMTTFLGLFAAQRRHQQQRLEELLQRGTYRIVADDGRSVPPSELLAQLGAAPARQPSRGTLAAAMGVVALGALIAAVVVLSAAH